MNELMDSGSRIQCGLRIWTSSWTLTVSEMLDSRFGSVTYLVWCCRSNEVELLCKLLYICLIFNDVCSELPISQLIIWLSPSRRTFHLYDLDDLSRYRYEIWWPYAPDLCGHGPIKIFDLGGQEKGQTRSNFHIGRWGADFICGSHLVKPYNFF